MHRSATERRAALLWFGAYFAAALLPRLSPLLGGVLLGDDFIHRPEGHLLSYRFLNYAELSFWELCFGSRYLLSLAPKIVGALYTAGLCSVMRSTLREWGAAPRVATLMPLLLPLHPLWNTFIAWNSTSVYVLSLLLIVVGYRWLSRGGTLLTIGAVLLMALGISGYQVHVGVFPALVFAEIVLSEEKLLSWARVAARRLLACGGAAALYFFATRLAVFAGLRTWGGRGFPSTIAEAAGSVNATHSVIDNLGVITQPFLSFYGGMEAAWRLWTVPYLIVAVLTGAVLFAGRRLVLASATRCAESPLPTAASSPRGEGGAKRRVRGGSRNDVAMALLTLLLPLSAASVVLALNMATSGPRVAAAIWMATLFAALPLLQRLDAMRRWSVALVVTLFIAAALPVVLTDAQNRTDAWDADRQTADAILEHWGSASGVTIVIHRTSGPPRVPAEWRRRPVVMQNFGPVTPFDYSNIRDYPEWLLASYGFRVELLGTDMPGPPTAHSQLAEWRHEPSERQTFLAPYGWRPRN